MTQELRVAIVGYGDMGRLHFEAFRQSPGVKVVAVAESDPGRVSDLPPDVASVADYNDLRVHSVDAVSICLPTHLHYRTTLHFLQNRTHVLLEKPIAFRSSEASEMIALAKAQGRKLFVGMTHRFYPELVEAKSLVDAGTIGSIVACRDSDVCRFDPTRLSGWYLDKAKAGGGAVLTDGIHLIDRLSWFVGADVAEVGGYMGRNFHEGSVEDTAVILLRFSNGILAQVFFAWLASAHPCQCTLQVVGTKGSITVYTWSGYRVETADGAYERWFYRDEPLIHRVGVGILREVEEFCNSIRENREPAPPADQSAKALGVIEQFYNVANKSRFGHLKHHQRIRR